MSFRKGDPVEITEGSYRGEVGMVLKPLPGNWYKVLLPDKRVEVPEDALKKA